MKAFYVTFGMAGFLLSSAVVAQANPPCPTVDAACTLCEVQFYQGKPVIDKTTGFPFACGNGWPIFSGAFHTGSPPSP